ncbi:MAG: hypothetical protein HYU71_11755 [Bacteroidetes bacterium]|nr:hypothetical protein [Bacteroidota bacterium]
MKKRFCTVFLLLVLAIQILPIRQMGGLLFSNQFTEELPHSIHVEKSGFQKAFLRNDHFSNTVFTHTPGTEDRASQHQLFADAIPQNFTGDIHVPPPNC